MHSLLTALATSPSPAPSPSLRPGLDQDQVTPGLLGFLLTAFIVVLTALLIVDMVRRIRRVRYRAQVEEERAGADESAQFEAAQHGAGGDSGRPGDGGRTGGDRPGTDGADTRPEANGDAGPGTR